MRDESDRILVQYRSAQKKSYPNLWTDSTSGHVDEGDTYDTAIARELEEEIGIATELKFVGKFESEDIVDNKIIREFNAIYEGRIASDTKLHLQESEVSEVKWFRLDELKQMMQNEPELFTPGFRETIARFY